MHFNFKKCDTFANVFLNIRCQLVFFKTSTFLKIRCQFFFKIKVGCFMSINCPLCHAKLKFLLIYS